VNNSQTDTDRVECISEGHLQFMREFIRKEEEICKAALDRFVAARMSQRDRTWQTSSKKAVGFPQSCSGLRPAAEGGQNRSDGAQSVVSAGWQIRPFPSSRSISEETRRRPSEGLNRSSPNRESGVDPKSSAPTEIS